MGKQLDKHQTWVKAALSKMGRGAKTDLAKHMADRNHAGFTADMVSKIISGERKVKAGEVLDLADFFGEQNTRLIEIAGKVGANPDGSILYAEGQGTGDFAPAPPWGSVRAIALEVEGNSMRRVAASGALVYYDDRRNPPTDDMLGEVVVVGLDTGEVLIKRLLRGSAPGLFDLESEAGEMRRDVSVEWAAHITWIIPPYMARQVIVRGSL